MEHPHVATYLAARQSLEAGDAPRLLSHLADEVEWWDLGAQTPVRGHRAVAEHVGTPTTLPLEHEIHDVLVNDEHLVALVHATALRDERRIGVSYAEVLHFDDAGRIAKRQIFPADMWTVADLLT